MRAVSIRVVPLCVLFACGGAIVGAASVTSRASAANGAPPAHATAGLACVQDALGGTRAFAGVTSIRIKGNTKPFASTGMRPIPTAREIKVVFPNQYERIDLGQPFSPDGHGLDSILGFNGSVILNNLKLPNDDANMRAARLDFAQQMLMRLPRQSAGVILSPHTIQDAGQARLAIDASGPDGFKATLLADAGTCMPVAVRYEIPGAIAVRVDLSAYRAFGGIRFPTVLKTSRNGEPFAEESVSSVEVNAPDAKTYFAAAGR